MNQASKVLLASFMKTVIGALRPSDRLYTLGRQILSIALSAFMVLPAFLQPTVAQGVEEVKFQQVVTTPAGEPPSGTPATFTATGIESGFSRFMPLSVKTMQVK